MTTLPPPTFGDSGPFGAARKGEAGMGLGLPGNFVPDPPKPPASPPSVTPPSAAAASPATPTAQRNAWSATIARPEPLPKQPKGRWFVVALLFGMIAVMATVLFQSFAYFHIQGLVEGRVRQIAAPWDGCTHAIYVSEGEHVTAGQLLAVIENPFEQQQWARLSDELRIAQAALEAKGAELKFQTNLRGDRRHKAQAEYYELWGTLLAEQSRLSDLEAQKKRLQALRVSGSASVAEWESLLINIEGQSKKLEKLEEALREMKQRVELDDSTDFSLEMKPQQAQIQKIQADMARLRQSTELGQLRSPISGRVIRRYRFSGEPVKSGESILEVLEDDSLRVVVYLPQDRADHLPVGVQVPAYIAPSATATPCVVERIGDQLQPPPRVIDPNFPKSELLLPVFLRPLADQQSPTLRLGSKVRLPRQLNWRSSASHPPREDKT